MSCTRITWYLNYEKKQSGNVRCRTFLNISDAETGHAKVAKEVIAKVREHIGPVASFKDVVIVPRLPKTRSGKIARSTLAAIAAGQPYKVLTLLSDSFYTSAAYAAPEALYFFLTRRGFRPV